MVSETIAQPDIVDSAQTQTEDASTIGQAKPNGEVEQPAQLEGQEAEGAAEYAIEERMIESKWDSRDFYEASYPSN
jgi:hypothetical protein